MTRLLTLLLFSVSAVFPAYAQEGHPLVGTWQGEWGNSQFLTLILEWDGKTITGIANPGPDTMVDVGKVTLDSSTWTVTIDTDLKDDAGETFHFTAKGKIDNIGSPLRVLNAEWTAGSEKGSFVLARQGGA